MRGDGADNQLQFKSNLVCRVAGRHERNKDADEDDEKTKSAGNPHTRQFLPAPALREDSLCGLCGCASLMTAANM